VLIHAINTETVSITSAVMQNNKHSTTIKVDWQCEKWSIRYCQGRKK